MSLLLKALLCGLVAMFGASDPKWFGTAMFQRPIVLAPLIGAILGDFHLGVIIGGTLELVWLGMMNIGATTPTETITGSVLGTAFAILSGGGLPFALVIAIPVGFLGSYFKAAIYTFFSWYVHFADKYAEDGNIAGVNWIHISTSLIYIALFGVLNFTAIMFGSDAIKSFVSVIPQSITGGFAVASGLVVALGFAMLLNVMSTKKLIPYFFVGFLIAAYLKLDTIAVAGVAICIAAIKLFAIKPATENKLEGGTFDD